MYELKGITDNFVTTLGSVTIELQIGGEKRRVEFQVVKSDFPVPNEGILGKPFIIGHGTIINYQSKELILPPLVNLTILPRTEILVTIPASHKTEGSNILISSQSITNALTCGNCVTTVRNHLIYVPFINPTDNQVQLQIPQLEQLEHEDFYEANVHLSQISENTEPCVDGNRISRLRSALRTCHLNSEEKSSLLTIFPQNVKGIKSFLGLSGDVPFKWSDLCQQSFEKLKNLLINYPILRYPDLIRPFNLTCDASNYAIGCVLSQVPIGKDLPIAYASRTLNKAEINYNTTEKELASIVWGVKTFRPYLFGQQFNIITDHRALVWLFNLKDPGSRLTRWRLKLEEHQYTIHYKPGTNNTNADALSRINQVVTRSSKAAENSKHPDNTDLSKTSKPQNDHSTHQASSSIEIQITENYQEFLQADSSLKKPTKKISEVSGNIFEMDPTISLACCVSADFKMTHGVAVQMRRKFGNLTQLRRLQKKVTEVASLEITDRNIFYLLTKEKFWQKPTCEDIFQSLQNLKKICQERKVTRLACPRLAIDRDGIKWETVRSMLYYTFRNSEIEIKIVTQEQLSKEDQLRIIREFHETRLGGHQGINRTYQ
ncbi:hypothetical protein QTP88_019387 [Uroleucon formosanum]